MYDIVIIGGGPAGLTAAIKAGTEGLSALVVERGDAVGGRPLSSPLIENVPGWPEGISGPDLFGRLEAQARKFGTTIKTGQAIVGLTRVVRDGVPALAVMRNLDRGSPYSDLTTTDYARSVILATGEVTPRLDALRPFEGRGVDYSCDAALLDQHAGQHVVLVGGGNSCAQLALALCDTDAASVTIITRSPTTQTTSLYLRSRLAQSRAQVIVGEVRAARGKAIYGETFLGKVTVEREAFTKTIKADQAYVFVTGTPPTGWFPGALDARGYVLTGHDVPLEDWSLERHPYPQESSIPGVFVAGDVRAGATGGITAAFGEGTQAFQWIKREYLPGLIEDGPATGAQCVSPAREEALRVHINAPTT